MEPHKECDHATHHVDRDGNLQGSWMEELKLPQGRVVCGVCGRFYGYLSSQATRERQRRLSEQSIRDEVASARQFAKPMQAPPARPERRAGGIDYKQLRNQVSMQQVLQLMNYQPVHDRDGQLRGPCPIHGSQSPRSRSFSVNVERGVFQCFGCGAKGNQLDLWLRVSKLPSIYEACQDLCERLGIEPPRA